ncbi:hypothetical protein PC116_g28598 [Phytophthora cactorum]|nr:hypothetical protein PC119_g26497 [Phytophthora cactorum]KAG4222929.1 hypothetical protein PC116_g28598 [Phytophthora cactorum]
MGMLLVSPGMILTKSMKTLALQMSDIGPAKQLYGLVDTSILARTSL